MDLEHRILRLIAVGASVTANCQPCLQINVAKALENGATEDEIEEAIQVGRMVRQGAASKFDDFSSKYRQVVPTGTDSVPAECGCG